MTGSSVPLCGLTKKTFINVCLYMVYFTLICLVEACLFTSMLNTSI